MSISELITKLQELKDIHGDTEIMRMNYSYVYGEEFEPINDVGKKEITVTTFEAVIEGIVIS
jgi:hypothetical protein